jgi:alkylglycerol monooxygenase
MGPNYIALAVPLFLALIGLELLTKRGRASYRFPNAITALGCGVVQRVMLLFYEASLLVVYTVVYRHARLFDLEARPGTAWIVALVGVDFIYYWWHRASHRVNVLWAAHIVHHQSEEYNLAVALRQGVFTPITALPFSLPLAVLGVPPLIYVAADALDTLYQFWIHTEWVRRLGPLEAVLNTPSHHRVHHGRNPQYLDRNYGGILIIWDRLFGTFEPEREPVVYGITKPLQSFNPLWAQLHHFWDLARQAGAATAGGGWWKTWLRAPDHDLAPDGAASALAGATAPTPLAGSHGSPRHVALARPLLAYVLANFGLAVVVTFCLMMWQAAVPSPWVAAGAVMVLVTTVTMGGLMESKAWARPLELVRLGSVFVGVPVLSWLTGVFA